MWGPTCHRSPSSDSGNALLHKSLLPQRPGNLEKQHNHISSASFSDLNSVYITLCSSVRTSSMSFWLCWSDKQPRTCFSDSSNSSNSAGKITQRNELSQIKPNQHKKQGKKKTPGKGQSFCWIQETFQHTTARRLASVSKTATRFNAFSLNVNSHSWQTFNYVPITSLPFPPLFPNHSWWDTFFLQSGCYPSKIAPVFSTITLHEVI